MTEATKDRRYDIDWLRVIAILTIFVFHCTRFFDTEGWHLKNAEQSHQFSTVYEIKKKVDGKEKVFPVCLMVAQKL